MLFSPGASHTTPFTRSRAEGQGQSRRPANTPSNLQTTRVTPGRPRVQQTQAWPLEPSHPPLTLLDAPQPLAPPRAGSCSSPEPSPARQRVAPSTLEHRGHCKAGLEAQNDLPAPRAPGPAPVSRWAELPSRSGHPRLRSGPALGPR